MLILRNCLFAVAVCTALLFTAHTQAAITTYEVHSTDKINCSGSPHGFWSGRMNAGGGNCGAYYDYQPGSTLTIDTDSGKAVLKATAINPQGYEVAIHFVWKKLTDFENWSGMVKNGGDGDPSDWLFFAKGKGKIKFYRPDGKKFGVAKVKVVADTALQVGLGANDKSSAMGASSWMTYNFKSKKGDKTSTKFGGHWDFNMNLKKVPEPSTIALLALGLVGLTWKRRSSISAS